MTTLCKSSQIIAAIRKLIITASYHRTTKFTSLWTSATNELPPFLEQDVPEDILKVCF